MQYIDGEDLKSLLRRIGRLSNTKALEISQQLCSGLSAAHAKGVLHRDLKPANIMIDGNGQAHITDFGLATMPSKGQSTADSSGTPAYMAPEQVLKGATSVQSDLYSLGLVLYEVFTGRRAHPQRTLVDLQSMHRNASAPLKPSDIVDNLPPAVDVAIRRCLDPDPSVRPNSAANLARQLSAGDPLTAAMIADEAPSPELVATYGERGTLSPTIAGSLCAIVLFGLFAILLISGKARSVNLAGFESPEVLQRDARSYLEKFGYGTAGFDSAMGFLGREMGHGGESDPAFWYRESPKPLIGTQIPLEAMPANYGTMVNLLDPPWVTPGMLGMKLDPGIGNKLRWFRAIPEQYRFTETVQTKPQWSRWFDEDVIGFDLDSLTPAKWRHAPLDAFDHSAAWEGQLPGSGEKIYVEAASFRDRPTWFRIMKSSEFETPNSIPTPVYEVNRGTGFGLSVTNIITVSLVAFFALRNWRLRRCDRGGAWKIAVVVFAGQVIGWTCLTSHTISPSEYFLVRDGLKSAIGSAFTAWLVYLALEPFARKHAPNLLVSWSRAIDGRFSDPIVGRDCLIAATVAVVVEMLLNVIQSLPSAQPLGINPLPLGGWSGVIGSGIGGGTAFITWMLIIFTTFVVVLRYSRSRILACLFITLGIGLSVAARDANMNFALLYLSVAVLPALATLRFGLLCLVTFTILDNVLLQPITIDPTSFFFPASTFYVLFVSAAALWGAYISLGNRRRRLFL